MAQTLDQKLPSVIELQNGSQLTGEDLIVLSPSGALVLTAPLGRLELWDIHTGARLRSLFDSIKEFPKPIWGAAFSPDERTAIFGGDSGALLVADTLTGKIIRTLTGHTGDVRSVVVSQAGTQALSGSDDGTLRLWDIETGRTAQIFKGHKGIVEAVALSPDGTMAVSGGADHTIRTWNLSTGHEILKLSGHTSWIKSVAFSRDGAAILSLGQDNIITVWNVATGRLLQRVVPEKSCIFRSVTVLANNSVAAICDTNMIYWIQLNGQPAERTMPVQTSELSLRGGFGNLNRSVEWSFRL